MHKSGPKRDYKRLVRRARRRMEKKLLEDAPKKLKAYVYGTY